MNFKERKLINVLIADKVDLSYIKLLPPSLFNITCSFGIGNKEIIKYYADYNVIIIRSSRKIDNSFLKSTRFNCIATFSRGMDNIDVSFALKRKIKIINSVEANSLSTAEHTMALILQISKNIHLSDKYVRKGKFQNTDFDRYELSGKKIGIIGIGKVGSKVAKLSEAFEMIVYANDIDKKVRIKHKDLNFISVSKIFSNCDIVTIHIPLNEKNYNFISKEKLDMLNESSVLINTSRGGIIDEEHLLFLLEKKKIKYAGLDVFRNEPHINRKFFKLNNVILTNHIAGKTKEAYAKMSEEIFSGIINFYRKWLDL